MLTSSITYARGMQALSYFFFFLPPCQSRQIRRLLFLEIVVSDLPTRESRRRTQKARVSIQPLFQRRLEEFRSKSQTKQWKHHTPEFSIIIDDIVKFSDYFFQEKFHMQSFLDQKLCDFCRDGVIFSGAKDKLLISIAPGPGPEIKVGSFVGVFLSRLMFSVKNHFNFVSKFEGKASRYKLKLRI